MSALEERSAYGPSAEEETARLFDAHSAEILAFCRRQLASRSDAEDALQTTFVYVLRALRRGVVPEHESAWLTTIAKNVCHTQRRTLGRRGPLSTDLDLDRIALAEPEPDEADLLAALPAALASLPDSQRNAIVMREWLGLGPGEIATRLELTTPATNALLTRARHSLAVGTDYGCARAALGTQHPAARERPARLPQDHSRQRGVEDGCRCRRRDGIGWRGRGPAVAHRGRGTFPDHAGLGPRGTVGRWGHHARSRLLDRGQPTNGCARARTRQRRRTGGWLHGGSHGSRDDGASGARPGSGCRAVCHTRRVGKSVRWRGTLVRSIPAARLGRPARAASASRHSATSAGPAASEPRPGRSPHSAHRGPTGRASAAAARPSAWSGPAGPSVDGAHAVTAVSAAMRRGIGRRAWREEAGGGSGRKRFRYVDARDVEITDEEQLERIRSLAIPPAWTDVWISPNAAREASGDRVSTRPVASSTSTTRAFERLRSARSSSASSTSRRGSLDCARARAVTCASIRTSTIGRAPSRSASSTRRGSGSARTGMREARGRTA